MGTQSSISLSGVTEVYPGMSVIPGGGRTMLVHSSGASVLDGLPAGFAGNSDGFFQSAASALASGRAGRGDKIILLPGHTESIGAADAWSNLGSASDVEIVGIGDGSNRPTLTWTAAGSTMLFDRPNVKLRNCRLFLAGAHAAGTALTVAAPITVSADGCAITDCEIAAGFDADQIVGVGITIASTRFDFSRNKLFAETAAAPSTTLVQITAADHLRMDDTEIVGPGSSTTIGPIQELTTASLKKTFRRCFFHSTTANSTVVYTAIAGTGVFMQCGLAVGTGTLAVTASSAMVAAGGTYTFSRASGLQTLLAIT